jgi:hypothetical protein
MCIARCSGLTLLLVAELQRVRFESWMFDAPHDSEHRCDMVYKWSRAAQTREDRARGWIAYDLKGMRYFVERLTTVITLFQCECKAGNVQQ